jgi:hypothetical protein
MPEIATQTEWEPPQFKVLTPEEEKKLTIRERKEYRKELKMHKKAVKRKKYNEYMRVYMSNYRKMKYKYDPAYREKVKFTRRFKYYSNKAIRNGVIPEDIPKEDLPNLICDLFNKELI